MYLGCQEQLCFEIAQGCPSGFVSGSSRKTGSVLELQPSLLDARRWRKIPDTIGDQKMQALV